MKERERDGIGDDNNIEEGFRVFTSDQFAPLRVTFATSGPVRGRQNGAVGNVGGSFSARVPRSSAELHRDFSDDILEDEVDRQEEEQGDQRDGDEEREENGVGELNQRGTHTAR